MKPRMLIALLALVGTFVALYLTLYKIGVIGELTCSVGSCETVNTSRWAIFLGLPVAAWGLASYLVVLLLALIGAQRPSRAIAWAIAVLATWNFCFSMWLTYLERYVIHAYCMWCLISATIVTLIFLTAIVDLRRELREG
ncbi:MAG TPA: vitamin K epoxide reductase family protein [Gemmatimonadaceae bacterium]|nr:vitamin K epoxide reductase family protein [Gemmatimonadaceae bacterium]